MNVTINTDASWKEGASGYAFWISTPVGKFKRWGRMQEDACDCTAAEIMAIANALHFTSKHPKLKGRVNKVIINTDSTFGINYIERGKGKVKGWNKSKNLCRRLLKNFKWEMRDIKAHSKDLSESRIWVNDWCDKYSKMGRKMNKLKKS